MTIYFSLLVAVIGAALYLMASNGKAQEIGRITYGAGLLAFLLRSAEHLVDLITK